VAKQIVFIALAIIAGLVVGVGIGYLVNINQVNSLNVENAFLRYQVNTLKQNLTAYNSSYQTLQALYDAVRHSYQSLTLQYSDLNLEYNSAMANLRTLNSSHAFLVYQYNLLVASYTSLLENSYNVTFLPNGTYSPQALSGLAMANSSILIVMHGMEYDPGASNSTANDLVVTLASAKGRGVDVKVLLDDYTLEQYPETIAFLENGSVPVRLDPSNATTTNANLVIIDGKTAFIGSGGWTESALSDNNELAVMLTGNMTSVTAYFTDLWNGGRAV